MYDLHWPWILKTYWMNSCIVTSRFLYTQLSIFNHSFFIMYDYYCKAHLTSFSVKHHVNNYVFHLFVFLAIACILYMISIVCATVNKQIKQAPIFTKGGSYQYETMQWISC